MVDFFADIPLSVGILEPCSHPLHLNTIEFLWDPVKNASVFIQVVVDSSQMFVVGVEGL